MEQNQVRTVEPNKVKSMVITAIFAAITYLGIQVFRIPLPAAVGTPFVHFGHIFVVMGVLLTGGKRGAISGTAGLLIFDLLNGYIKDMPQVAIVTIIKCLILGFVLNAVRKKAAGDENKEYHGIILCTFVYAGMHIVIELLSSAIELLILGSSLQAAVWGAVTSIPAVLINATFMIVVVLLIYKPIKRVYNRTVQ